MGLDMTLKKKTYIGAEYDSNNVKGSVKITKQGKPVKINFKRISEIVENVGYWRKANAIHKWFVDNCQDGEDDCREAYVSKEQLIDLLNTCKKVVALKSKSGKKIKVKAEIEETAEDLLPTQEGFFFGGTNIDEYYYQSIDETIRIVDELLKECIDGSDIYYQSSW